MVERGAQVKSSKVDTTPQKGWDFLINCPWEFNSLSTNKSTLYSLRYQSMDKYQASNLENCQTVFSKHMVGYGGIHLKSIAQW